MYKNYPVLRCRGCGSHMIFPYDKWKFRDDSKIFCDSCIGEGRNLSVLISDGWKEADWQRVKEGSDWYDTANIKDLDEQTHGYVQFEKIEQKPKTAFYLVTSIVRAVPLGQVHWIAGWKKYAFRTSGDTCLDAASLKEITNFIEDLMRGVR